MERSAFEERSHSSVLQYTLDEEPNLGKWLIKVKYDENGTVEGKSQFEVTLDEGQDHVVLKDCNEETYGANVKGQAYVTIITKYKVGTYWRPPYSTV